MHLNVTNSYFPLSSTDDVLMLTMPTYFWLAHYLSQARSQGSKPQIPSPLWPGQFSMPTICRFMTGEEHVYEDSRGRGLETPYPKDVREEFIRLVS